MLLPQTYFFWLSLPSSKIKSISVIDNNLPFHIAHCWLLKPSMRCHTISVLSGSQSTDSREPGICSLSALVTHGPRVYIPEKPDVKVSLGTLARAVLGQLGVHLHILGDGSSSCTAFSALNSAKPKVTGTQAMKSLHNSLLYIPALLHPASIRWSKISVPYI